MNAGDVVRQFYESWNRGNIDFPALVADDIVNHQPEVEPERGLGAFADAISGVMAAVPDSQWTISDMLVDGDRVAVARVLRKSRATSGVQTCSGSSRALFSRLRRS